MRTVKIDGYIINEADILSVQRKARLLAAKAYLEGDEAKGERLMYKAHRADEAAARVARARLYCYQNAGN